MLFTTLAAAHWQPLFKKILLAQKATAFLPGEYVFVTKDAASWDNDDLRRQGMVPGPEEGGYEESDMDQIRYTFGTLTGLSGENPNWVAQMMGHTLTETTATIYNLFTHPIW